jgi:hypothetical protein
VALPARRPRPRLAAHRTARRRRGRLEIGSRRTPGEQIEYRTQPPLHLGEPLARVLADQLVEDRRVGRNRPRFLFEPTPRTSERQPFDEQQISDPHHLLDIRAPIDARAAVLPGDAKTWKLGLPRTNKARLGISTGAAPSDMGP